MPCGYEDAAEAAVDTVSPSWTETGARATRGGSLRGFASWGLRGGLFWRLGLFCGLGEEMRVVMWPHSLIQSGHHWPVPCGRMMYLAFSLSESQCHRFRHATESTDT